MKSKILILSIVFILISFIFINNSVFANSFSISDEKRNTIEKLMEEYTDCNSWVSVDYRNQSSILLFNCPEGVDVFANGTIMQTCDGSIIKWYCFWYYPETDTYDLFWSGDSIGHGEFNLTTLYSNRTIYTDKEKTEIFFQPTPVTGTLVPILEKVEMKEPMMKEILTLVPIMIILIVSYLALRKGLAFIKTLRKM